jgi:hypothetical protein
LTWRLVVGVSGPDGAGKSTLVAEIRRRAKLRGVPVRTVYLYGCVVCRHARPRPAAPGERESHGSPIAWAGHHVHALVDGLELALRLLFVSARFPSRRWARPTLILTDRTPLDGLAKHDPSPRSVAAHVYRGLARRYHRIFLVDAPAEVLAERDREHSPHELDRWRTRFERWAAQSDSTVRLESASRSASVLAEQVLDLLALPDRSAGSAPDASRSPWR